MSVSSKVKQLMNRARSQMKAGKFRLARRNLEKLLEIDTSNDNARKSLAVCILNNPRASVKDTRFAMEVILPSLKREDPEAWAIAGDVLLAQDKVPQAQECYRKAVESGFRGPEVLTRLGETHYNLGDVARAKEFLHSALTHSDYVPALRRLASIYGEQGEPHKAIRLLRKAVKAMPSLTSIYSQIGHIYLGSLRSLHHAEVNFKRALLSDTNDALAYHGLGMLHMIRGDSGKALDFHEKALRVDPKCVPALESAGTIYEQKGDMSKAEKVFKKAATIEPNDWCLILNLGRVYLSRNKTDKAIEEFRRILDVPGYAIAARYYLGQGYLSNGDTRKAVQMFEEALRIIEENPGSLQLLPSRFREDDFRRELAGLLSLASTLVEDKEAAVKVLERLVQKNPREVLFSLSLASVYADLGQFERALAEIEKARKRHPDDSKVYVSKGWVCGLMGDGESARQAYERAATLEPENEEVLTSLGDAVAQEGDWERARSVWEKALEINDKNPEIWVRLAMTYEHLGELSRSRRYWEDFLKATTAPESLPYLAEVSFRMGDLGSAKEYCDSALKHCRADGLANFILGLLCCAQGDSKGSLTAWKTAWAREPEVLSIYYDLVSLLPPERIEALGQMLRKSKYRGDFKQAVGALISNAAGELPNGLRSAKKEGSRL